jgi:hypothetical protein
MSIENLERMKNAFSRAEYIYPEDTKIKNPVFSDVAIEHFMTNSINLHKDHIEKIAEMEKQIAQLSKRDDKEFLKGEEYHYEPNE